MMAGIPALVVSAALCGARAASLTVDVDKPGVAVSPTLYGIFFEEINRAGDGGLYAEMIQNRAFEDSEKDAVAWSLVKDIDAGGSMELDRSKPLNEANPTSLKLDCLNGRVGIANEGFTKGEKDELCGMAVRQGKVYRLSLYARGSGSLEAILQTRVGKPLASQKIEGIGRSWKKFTCDLTANANEDHARLLIVKSESGTVWLDVVSLFPKDTFKGRENGLRADLGQMVADMHPGFVRFPGGCYVEGGKLADAFRWKKTIGDIAERPGHWNLWGYRSNDGLGYLEYLELCEDIGAEPLYVINCGMSHEEQGGKKPAPKGDELNEYVQDALDAIEYANGGTDTKWGALRAKHGHPAPFNMKMMEIGNENGGPIYNEHFAKFHDAIKAKYPDFKLVANVWGGIPGNRKVDIVDEHYYNTPQFFMANANKYDKYDREKYKVYVGEYAVTQGCGQGNLIAAVGEAAFMTGMERNGDVVAMCSYAPLFVHPSWRHWNPNAIVFDAARSYGTPSYYCQALFGANRADTVLPLEMKSPPGQFRASGGMIGVGTWLTRAEFKDIKVTQDGKTLFESDFSKNLTGWKTSKGEWSVKDGALVQSGHDEDVRAFAGDKKWTDYTYSLKARKLGGSEGFLIIFQSDGKGGKNWWNIGGWGNTRHGLECAGIEEADVPGKIETGKWYDIRIEVAGARVRCYLDDKLVHDVTRAAGTALFAMAGRKNDTGEVIVKVVNTSADPQETEITLRGATKVESSGRAIVLTGEGPDDENTFEAPAKIATKDEVLKKASAKFTRTMPPFSVTVLRLKAQP